MLQTKHEGRQAMCLQIRDDRQMKALTGLSQPQFDQLLPVFSDAYDTTRQQTYEQGVAAGTRQRKPGGGKKTAYAEEHGDVCP